MSRPVDVPHEVLIDLEFDTREEAEAMLGGLRTLWERVEGTIVSEPMARILEPLELVEYRSPSPPPCALPVPSAGQRRSVSTDEGQTSERRPAQHRNGATGEHVGKGVP